jgi:hypothetical protein
MPWNDPVIFMKSIVGPHHGLATRDLREETDKKKRPFPKKQPQSKKVIKL